MDEVRVASGPRNGADAIADDHALESVREALRGLRFGSVLVIVQDGVVVQVERTEKRRLVRSRSEPSRMTARQGSPSG